MLKVTLPERLMVWLISSGSWQPRSMTRWLRSGQAFVPLIQDLLPGCDPGLKGFGDCITDNMPTYQDIIGNVLGFIGSAIGFIIENCCQP